MNPVLIGNYIAEKRKSYCWTQRQLARQLNVTHQAVSRWEQGLALPDIETLVAMARLFGITVDMLLNPEKLNRPVPEAYSGTASPEPAVEEPKDEEEVEDLEEEEDEEGNVDEEQSESEETIDLGNLGDYISEQVRAHMPNFNGRSFNMSKYGPYRGRRGKIPHMPHIPNIPPMPKSIEYDGRTGRSISININTNRKKEQKPMNDIETKLAKLEDLAPFVSREVLSQKFLELISQTDKVCPELICDLAPFLNRDALSAALEKVDTENMDTDFISDIAPFVRGPKLAELISRIKDKEWLIENFEDLVPFLPRDVADKIFLELF